MPFSSIVQAEAVAMLRRILDIHCDTFGIFSDEERTSLACRCSCCIRTASRTRPNSADTEPKDRFQARR